MTASTNTRRDRIALGLCAVCLRRQATAGHVTCAECREAMQQYDAARAEQRRSDKLCARCGETAPTSHLCTTCSRRRRRTRRRVYFMRAGELIKIGSTSNLRTRLRVLQSHSPHQLALLGVIGGGERLERDLHRRFARLRNHGEWYVAAPELLDTIAVLLAG